MLSEEVYSSGVYQLCCVENVSRQKTAIPSPGDNIFGATGCCADRVVAAKAPVSTCSSSSHTSTKGRFYTPNTCSFVFKRIFIGHNSIRTTSTHNKLSNSSAVSSKETGLHAYLAWALNCCTSMQNNLYSDGLSKMGVGLNCSAITHGSPAQGSRGVRLGNLSNIGTGVHPRIDVRNCEAIPVVFVFVVVPSMLSPNTLIE